MKPTTTPYPSILTNSVTSLRDALTNSSTLSEEAKARLTAKLSLDFINDFASHAHPHQRPPRLANSGAEWTTWLILGGRGAGKTRAGAEWVRSIALNDKHARIALIGETEHEVRSVMVEGVSGLLAAHRSGARPQWTPTTRRVEWPGGAVAEVFSAENYEALRGPQFSAAWCDELAKWRQAEATFDMLQFGLRLGERPRQVVTTTPRPIALLKRLIDDPRTAVTHAGTRANAYNLAPAFVETVLARYQDTRLGRQEIAGEIVEERADALWTRARIEDGRIAAPPPLNRIVVAVDPPASAKKGADACGIVAAGRADDGGIYVIADATVSGASPQGWATKAVALWRRLSADALVVETNQGGDMVKAVIREVDGNVPMLSVHATRGKYLRAEPVAQLYEQGRVRHAGTFPTLEDEMCDFGLDGLSSGRSPDRLDALVWAVTALTFGARGEPRIREL
ncbi:MAG: DNA-packaging protein [Rhizobiales bacterium]|nr:DNA-packaging protein [Hyphomicrobiales bacterium]